MLTPVVAQVVLNRTAWKITVLCEEPVRYQILTDRLLPNDCYQLLQPVVIIFEFHHREEKIWRKKQDFLYLISIVTAYFEPA